MESTVANEVSWNPTTAMSACTYALIKYDERFLKKYLEDCKNDPDLKSFDENMEKDSKALIKKLENSDEVVSLELLGGAVTTMSNMGQGIANALATDQSQITAMKDNSYHVVVNEYLKSSLEILNFCTDVEEFSGEARSIHSYITEKIEECIKLGMKPEVGRKEAREISNILNNIMASTAKDKDHTAQKLRIRAGILLQNQQKMFDCVIQLHEKIKEKGEAEKRVSFWGKVLNYLYIGLKIVAIVAATVFAILAQLSGLLSPFKGLHWIFALCLGLDREASKEDELNSMKKGALHSLRDIGEIQDAINSVIKAIELLLATSTNIANGETIKVAFTNIKKLLDKFSNKIDDLETKTEDCRNIIKSARKKLF